MKLDSDLSIRNAELLYAAFENEYEKGADVSLHASDVERIDTTIFQIIVALKMKLQSENMDLNIIEPSAEFIDSAELLGLASMLELAPNQH
ncbi:MAG: STAS domain-containing protein [Pseudomonadales bacterium]|nr:STAS domain-containing protein [Pseudomonadales bacterium]